MAYKGRIGTKETERHYPHIVEMIVPLKGFGTRLNDMHSWHSTRGIQSQRGRGRYHNGRHFGVLMQSKSATADDSPETRAKREFDRWRVAVDIIRRLREAGIACELNDIPQMQN